MVTIVANSPSTKSFFLEDKSFIKDTSALFIRGSKVKVWHTGIHMLQQMLEKQI